MNNITSAVQNVPGYGIATDMYENYASEHFKTKDPFYVEVDGKEKRRKPPPGITDKQRNAWKAIIKKAWYHDRNFCGCVGLDISLGMIPIVNVIPVIGPIIAYTMHSTLVKRCADAGLPAKNQAAMLANVTFDFVISLVPLLGILFSWLNSCSTRNAALFDTWLKTQGDERTQQVERRNEHQASQEEDLQRRMKEIQQTSGRPADQTTGQNSSRTTRNAGQTQNQNTRQVQGSGGQRSQPRSNATAPPSRGGQDRGGFQPLRDQNPPAAPQQAQRSERQIFPGSIYDASLSTQAPSQPSNRVVPPEPIYQPANRSTHRAQPQQPAYQSPHQPPSRTSTNDSRIPDNSQWAQPRAQPTTIDDRSLAQLVDMGFSTSDAHKALAATNGNVQEAINWITTEKSSAQLEFPRQVPRPRTTEYQNYPQPTAQYSNQNGYQAQNQGHPQRTQQQARRKPVASPAPGSLTMPEP